MAKYLLHGIVSECSSTKSGIMLASNNPKKRAGRKKFCETRHPIYRGVRKRKSGKWVCEIREPNKKSRIWLGTYPTVEMAARAHDVAAIALRGKLACLNFADSSWRLPIPASSATKDIQKAAADAAETFRPSRTVYQSASTEDIDRMEEEDMFSLEDKVFLMDEDDVICMHMMMIGMAEGMMLPPLIENIDVEGQEDHQIKLWSF